MKISPIASGGNGSHAGVNVGRTATPEKLAAAKAIAAGETPIQVTQSDTPTDRQVSQVQESIKKIKMRTQRSPDRPIEEAPVEEAPESVISDPAEQVTAAIEDTKPLSPQLAALAKQRRALQVKERELADREKAIESKSTNDGTADLISKLQTQPLSVLREAGLMGNPDFYSQLTQAILDEQNGVNPEVQALKKELEAVKNGIDEKFTSREAQQEEAALTEMLYEAEALGKEGDAYELIREEDAYDQVLRRIHDTYRQSGRVLDVAEAMNFVENQLLEKNLKAAKYKKVQSKLAPEPVTQQPQKQGMRTLTNRDNATPQLDRRSRAMAAFHNQRK